MFQLSEDKYINPLDFCELTMNGQSDWLTIFERFPPKYKYKKFWPNLFNILPLGTKRRTGHKSFQASDNEREIGNINIWFSLP